MMIPLLVLLVVFVLIAVRKVGHVRLQIWQVMSFGAAAVLLTGQISPVEALRSINVEVMLFLFSMFVVGVALVESGYLSHISYWLFKRARNTNQMLLFVLFGMGFASAVLMNDTLAIVGTPMMVALARKHGVSPKALLMALAFAVTIGSATSPFGNPQNFLIATQGGVENPLVVFLRYLLGPTILNLLVAFLLLKAFFKNDFRVEFRLNHVKDPLEDPRLRPSARRRSSSCWRSSP
ncbi:MAG: hypothetical protein Kow0069_38390 [Promethearchaeota archaeon]